MRMGILKSLAGKHHDFTLLVSKYNRHIFTYQTVIFKGLNFAECFSKIVKPFCFMIVIHTITNVIHTPLEEKKIFL